MKGRSEKLYDPCHVFLIYISVTQYPSKTDTESQCVERSIPLLRHYGVLFKGQSYLCFSIMSIRTKFSDLRVL